MAGSAFLSEIGDVVEYSVHAEVAEPTDNLVVSVSVPAELDVSSVPLDDQAEAISAGLHGKKEDIVWVIGDAKPGDSIDLQWFGRVSAPGDLMATAVAEARTDDASATDAADTFLAAPPQVATEKAQPTEVLGKVIKRVPVTIPAPAGAVLPVTGWSPSGPLWIAFALLAFGGLLMLIGVTGMGAARITALVLVLAVMTACTTATNDNSAAPTDGATEAAPEPEVEPTPADQVKGKRIFNNDPAVVGTDEATDSTEPPATITLYRNVLVDVDVDADLLAQTDRTSDNTMSFSWTEPDRNVATATSGLMFTPEPISELMVGLTWTEDGLTSSVTLTNASSEPLRVQGRLLLDVTDSSGTGTSLSSDPMDVVLAPGGEVEATYRYLLPTGEYTLISRFEN
jgi:hypothetical protein